MHNAARTSYAAKPASSNRAAEEYFKDRFKWTKVDSGRINDLLDNANDLELEINEGDLAALRAMKQQQQIKALYSALQTKAFLQRTMQDIRYVTWA